MSLVEGLAIIATLCAVLLTGLAVRREFLSRRDPSAAMLPNRRLDDWAAIIADGRQLGLSNGIQVLVFSDFECPACRMFHERVLRPALQEFGSKITFIHRHLPLDYHRFARPAAQAAECAALSGHFFPMHDALFQYHDSLGLKPFIEIAAEAGVQDLIQFERCRKSSGGNERIDRDLSVAKALSLPGTPAIAIDGVLLGSAPDSASFVGMINDRLNGAPIPAAAGN